MKINLILLLLVIKLLTISAISESQDDLIAYDGFSGSDYGWLDVWTESAFGTSSRIYKGCFSYSSEDVVLQYQQSGIIVNGGKYNLKVSHSNSGQVARALVRRADAKNAFSETFYVSFLARLSSQPQYDNDYIAIGEKQNSRDVGVALGNYSKKQGIGANFACDGLQVSSFGEQLLEPNHTYFVVAKFIVNDNGIVEQVNSFVNPTSTILERAEWESTVNNVFTEITTIDLFAFFHGDAYFDEIRVGKTWASVVSSLDNSESEFQVKDNITTFLGPQGAWSDSTKWSNGLPTSETDTVFIAGTCTVDKPVYTKHPIVLPSASLVVVEGGALVSLNPLLLQAKRGAVGEYLQDTSVVEHMLDQQVFFHANQWNFVALNSTMTAGELFPNMKLAAQWNDPEADYWVLEYSEEQRALTQDGMVEVFDGNSPLEAGRGYMIWVKTDTVRTFSYSSSQQEVLTNTSNTTSHSSSVISLDHSGWNLVGNPLSHSIRYEEVFDSCAHNQAYFTGAVYVWDGLSYKVWSKGAGDIEAREIKPMEAFFVKRVSDDPAAQLFCIDDNGAQITSLNDPASHTFNEEKVNSLAISVNLQKGVHSDRTYIKIESRAYSGFDELYDAQKVFSNRSEYPEQDFIYSVNSTDKLALNALRFENEFLEVPITIDLASKTDSLMLSFSIEGDSSYVYTLIDDDEMTMTPLKHCDVMKLSTNNQQMIAGRFSVFVTKAQSVSALSDIVPVKYDLGDVVSIANGVRIQSKSLNTLSLAVFDLSGRVHEQSHLMSGRDVTYQLSSGVYFVRLYDGVNSEVQKIVIQ